MVPPLLMTPAKASNPFMNDTGPLAVPPPPSCSLELRRGERFVPVPLPYLKSIPSVLASPRMDSMVSSTELMKHADACGRVPGTPTLNHTGLLKLIFWCRTRWVSSSWNACASSSLAK